MAADAPLAVLVSIVVEPVVVGGVPGAQVDFGFAVTGVLVSSLSIEVDADTLPGAVQIDGQPVSSWATAKTARFPYYHAVALVAGLAPTGALHAVTVVGGVAGPAVVAMSDFAPGASQIEVRYYLPDTVPPLGFVY